MHYEGEVKLVKGKQDRNGNNYKMVVCLTGGDDDMIVNVYDPIAVTSGDQVSFEYEENGQWINLTKGTFKVLPPQAPQQQTATNAGSTFVPPNKREESIENQVIVKGIPEYINALSNAGVFPKTKGAAAAVRLAVTEFITICKEVYGREVEEAVDAGEEEEIVDPFAEE